MRNSLKELVFAGFDAAEDMGEAPNPRARVLAAMLASNMDEYRNNTAMMSAAFIGAIATQAVVVKDLQDAVMNLASQVENAH